MSAFANRYDFVVLFDVYPDSLKSREKFLAFRGSVDSDGA